MNLYAFLSENALISCAIREVKANWMIDEAEAAIKNELFIKPSGKCG